MERLAQLVFTSVIYPTRPSETDGVLMAESLRANAGVLARAPIRYFVPEIGKPLSPEARARLERLDVELIPFEAPLETLRFFFAGDLSAASLAESLSTGKTEFLVWLSSNTVFLREPNAFLLPEAKSLAYRPVHHTLVGSPFETDPDPFWALIYRTCRVPGERIFPMRPHVEQRLIRPYFNAGILVTRPEKGVFQAWQEAFFTLYQQPEMTAFYEKDERYRIFVHQAVLSGVVLSALETDELLELPPAYNYPVHLHAENPTDSRPQSLEELVTFRHEGFYRDQDWVEQLPAERPLKKWLKSKLLAYKDEQEEK